jgi:transglutaminase-like putative cysteine protease
MIYEITHTTTYDYLNAVALSHHLLRLHPRESRPQRVLTHHLQLDPRPTIIQGHVDYFGNSVRCVTVEGSHRRLIVRASSKVMTGLALRPLPQETPSWQTVRDSCRGAQIGAALEASDFLFDSPLIRTREEYGDYALPSFPADRPLLEGINDFTRRIHHDFKFDPKATTLATPLEQVFKSRRGVCQDFAHLQIACLRSLGLPARYVSGYLETQPPPGQARLMGADASHAWVSVYCTGLGWVDVDPTNNVMPTTRHVTVAWGRDYSDVSPIRGVILGSGEHQLKVAVDVVPVPDSD